MIRSVYTYRRISIRELITHKFNEHKVGNTSSANHWNYHNRRNPEKFSKYWNEQFQYLIGQPQYNMYGPKIARPSRYLAFNGVGFFRIPGQVAALRPTVIGRTRAASTSSGLWLPHLTQVSPLENRCFIRRPFIFFITKFVIYVNRTAIYKESALWFKVKVTKLIKVFLFCI